MKAAAQAHAIAVTTRVRDAVDVGAELGVVVAFGRLIPADVLDVLPIVNLHLSLLPRWRGAAPIERAILTGDRESGVSLMALDPGLDTGAVYETIATPIDPEETAVELGERLVALGTNALVDRLTTGLAGLGEARPQEGTPVYAEKLTSADRLLDFSGPADVASRVVRIGGATTTFRGAPLIVHRARLVPDGPDAPPGALVGDLVATGLGALQLVEVQAAGRRAQSFREFANGARLGEIEFLGVPQDDLRTPK